MEKILLVDSDHGLRNRREQALGEVGFEVVTAVDAAGAMKALYQAHPDMVIIGEGFPRPNSEHLCSLLRRVCHIPIIVLVDVEEAAARFLDMGADACLTRPLSLRLLLARVRSLFRRTGTSNSYNFPPGIRLDTEKHQLNLGGRSIGLTPTEFRLFCCLALEGGWLVPYPELAMGVWGREGVSPSSMKFYASSLRSKLGNDGHRTFYLLNGRGIGFRLVSSGDVYRGENAN
ncbi:response regulator transcription factor [Dehalococcoidia bacterium]|nr:response regulator transcription factor [Dehalococcoidia bacterium]